MTATKSPAILWFLDSLRVASARDGIRAAARDTIRPYIDIPPPYDPKRIAEDRRINEVSETSMGRSQHAVLIPKHGGFRVKLNRDLAEVRRRFSLAHEIGHTFFFSLSAETPFRPYKQSGRDWREERLCDLFAAEILTPEDVVRRDLEATPEPSLDSFIRLTKRYKVSSYSAAIRLERLGTWHAALVAWKPYGFRNHKGETKEERMRVLWSAAPRGCYVPKRDSLKNPGSLIEESYNGVGRFSGEERLDLGSLRGTYRVECVRISGAEGPYVLSLIHL